MIYEKRLCACGCGNSFWPHRNDQRYAGPWCRAAAWRRAHPDGLGERFSTTVRTDAPSSAHETFSGVYSAVAAAESEF